MDRVAGTSPSTLPGCYSALGAAGRMAVAGHMCVWEKGTEMRSEEQDMMAY